MSGCPVFPADNSWNRDVSGDPVDPRSDGYIASIGAAGFLHADFGSPPEYGIPWISGETNRLWDDADLDQLKTVPGSAFEVVRLGPILTN